jgi:hypothetical protein
MSLLFYSFTVMFRICKQKSLSFYALQSKHRDNVVYLHDIIGIMDCIQSRNFCIKAAKFSGLLVIFCTIMIFFSFTRQNLPSR